MACDDVRKVLTFIRNKLWLVPNFSGNIEMNSPDFYTIRSKKYEKPTSVFMIKLITQTCTAKIYSKPTSSSPTLLELYLLLTYFTKSYFAHKPFPNLTFPKFLESSFVAAKKFCDNRILTFFNVYRFLIGEFCEE